MLDTLDDRYIYQAVSSLSGLPDKALHLNGYLQLVDNIEEELKKRLVGQDEPIKHLCLDIRQKQIEWFSHMNECAHTLAFPATSLRPRFAALILGETGTGKTETAKIIADHLFSGNEITLRGQDVAPNNPHGTSSWVGAPPGYIGHGNGGVLTNGLRKSRFSCINLDEIEKASTTAVLEILMGLLGEAKVTDMNTGESLDASQCMVFATSNIRIETASSIGFNSGADHVAVTAASGIRESLMQYFPAELIGRFNGIYMFKALSLDDKWILLNRLINDFTRSGGRKTKVSFDAKTEMMTKIELGKLKTGARGVQDYFTSALLPKLLAATTDQRKGLRASIMGGTI